MEHKDKLKVGYSAAYETGYSKIDWSKKTETKLDKKKEVKDGND